MFRQQNLSNSMVYRMTYYIKEGNIDKVRETLSNACLDEKQGHTLLFSAVSCEQVEIVHVLLDQGCPVTFSGVSAPFRIAILRGNLKIVQLLVIYGADLLTFVSKNLDIFHTTGNYLCRLIYFVIQGRTTEVKDLLHQLKFPRVLRYEIIRLAVACGFIETVKELLSLNFEINMSCSSLKQTPLDIAISRNNFEMAELLEMEKAYLY